MLEFLKIHRAFISASRNKLKTITYDKSEEKHQLPLIFEFMPIFLSS